jgi:hypothetical protein
LTNCARNQEGIFSHQLKTVLLYADVGGPTSDLSEISNDCHWSLEMWPPPPLPLLIFLLLLLLPLRRMMV